MLHLFKRRRALHGRKGNSSLAGRAALLQRNWAGWMGLQASRLSVQQQKLALLLFIFLTGCYFIFLTTQGILGDNESVLHLIPLSTPAHATSTGAEIIETDFPVSKAEFLKVSRFRDYMDSLARNPSGKDTHDSIILARPGLMDSITLIENYYQSYYKN